ncbi:hypothetical protein F4824DRAFT_351539 [Ustulina deusta]|nr:hypothetical protein F4824DRAFT_351539 [Ustulina deusta]
MKASVVLAAVSASVVVADMLPPPNNFPACGTTCFGNMLGQASQLGCGGGGSTENAVDSACLCKNVDFSYGIIDCANAACPEGVAPTVVQYGVDWCAEKGILISGLSATPNPTISSSVTFTVSAVATTSGGSNGSGTASATTATNSDGSPVTTTLSNNSSETSGVQIPISTTEIVSILTNSNGAVVTTTISTSTIFSDVANGSGTESGSATDSGSASESTFFTESTNTAGSSAEVTSAATSAATSESAGTTEGAPTTTSSHAGSWQTAAPVGLVAAAGLAAMML